MKYTKWIAALILVLVPLMASAQLGQTQRVVTQVPFHFTVGNVAIPAGEVTVQRVNGISHLLTVGNHDAKVALFTLPVRADGKKVAPVSAMVFHKYGNRYFLAGLNIADSRGVYTFEQSKLEKELAQNMPVTEQVVLASMK